MRAVIWTDRAGYKRRSLIRDSDPDDTAPFGIPAEPPRVDALDWEGIKQDIQNGMMDRGLVTWLDVQRARNQLSAIVRSALVPRLVVLYKQAEQEAKET